MTSASHTPLFALCLRLLYLLLLTHETQSCPKSIQFDCPDYYQYTGKSSLDFPFTNSSLPDCGVFTLNCENEHTMINCMGWGHPEAHYRVLHVNQSEHTIVAAYPQHWEYFPHSKHWEEFTYSHAPLPSTPSVKFTTLKANDTIIMCPDEDGSSERDSQPSKNCSDDGHHLCIAYGPYKLGLLPPNLGPPPPGCSLKNNSFSIQYNITAKCQRCLDKGGRCYDGSNNEVGCYGKNKGK